MTVLLDQRQMSGLVELTTVEEIREFWGRQAERSGFELRHDDRPVKAYVSDGRWVARCLNCPGGIAAGPRFEEGACLSCGTIFPLEHPDDDTVAAVEAVFKVRPPERRHWEPWVQTVDDLREENVIHGYMSDAERFAGEVERIAVATALKPSTVERVLKAQG